MVFKTIYMLPNAADFLGLDAQREEHRNMSVFVISFFKNYQFKYLCSLEFLLSDFPSVQCSGVHLPPGHHHHLPAPQLHHSTAMGSPGLQGSPIPLMSHLGCLMSGLATHPPGPSTSTVLP